MAKQRWVGLVMLAGLLAACPWLTGCSFFFVCDKASCATSGSGASSTGDYAYVADSTKGTQYIDGYELSTGSPVALSGSPYLLSYVPTAMVVTPGNGILFIASGTSPYGIYAYTVASNGSLTIANSGVAVANGTAAAMDVTPDGKYLFVLNTSTLATTVDEYSITSSTGVLTPVVTEPSGLIGGNAAAIKVAPSANFVVISLGTAGDEVFPLTSGVFSAVTPTVLTFTTSGVADFGVTVDANNNVYFARTGLVAAYSATSTGALTAINNTSGNSTTGSGDHSIVLSNTGTYLYTGNAFASTISGFSNSNGTLGVVSGSPYNAPSSVASLAADKTGKYLVAAGYNSSGFVEYAIGSSGALTASSTAASTSSSVVPIMTLTH